MGHRAAKWVTACAPSMNARARDARHHHPDRLLEARLLCGTALSVQCIKSTIARSRRTRRQFCEEQAARAAPAPRALSGYQPRAELKEIAGGLRDLHHLCGSRSAGGHRLELVGTGRARARHRARGSPVERTRAVPRAKFASACISRRSPRGPAAVRLQSAIARAQGSRIATPARQRKLMQQVYRAAKVGTTLNAIVQQNAERTIFPQRTRAPQPSMHAS